MRTVPGIRLIASDYDGTLANRGKIDPALGQELASAIGAGRIFAIVTGRPLAGLLEALAVSGLPSDAYPQAAICEERDVHIRQNNTYVPWQEHNDAALASELQLLPYTRQIADDLRLDWPKAITGCGEWSESDLIPFEQSSKESEESRGYVELRFANPQVARAVQEMVQERVNSIPNLITVRNGRLVTLRHSAYGKGRILDLLRRHLGLQASEVMAVGDSGNDLSMLNSNYGFCIATVANGDEEVKQAVAAHGGVQLQGRAGEGIRELLGICMWHNPDRLLA